MRRGPHRGGPARARRADHRAEGGRRGRQDSAELEAVVVGRTRPIFGGAAAGGHRYGAVLVLTLVLTTFALVAPEGEISRLVELAGAAATLFAAMLTAGARADVRRAALVAAVVTIVIGGGSAIAGAPRGMLAFAATAAVHATTIAVIVGGLVRLVQERGVGVQAVFGALAVYLLVGLAFGFLIGAVATGFDGPYFAQGTDGNQSQRIYFSFTALTTTGFGDYTAATRAGRALAVLEMLVGQLYLVTVIATLVGNLGRSRRSRSRDSGEAGGDGEPEYGDEARGAA